MVRDREDGTSDANQAEASRTLPGPLYREYLTEIIRQSRQAMGREIPWFVAQATYHVPGDEASPDIRAAQAARGQASRNVVLVPESAHGTNPATAAFLGYTVRSIPANANGTVDAAAVKAALGPDVAALMLTNPNTCGLFEPEIIEIAAAVHEAGAYFYCDGANFNAIMGVVRPGDLGIDAMHINLHKTVRWCCRKPSRRSRPCPSSSRERGI